MTLPTFAPPRTSQAGLAPWIAKADADLMHYHGDLDANRSITNDVDAVLGRKPTPPATFAKAMKPHVQSDKPIETPHFVKSLAAGQVDPPLLANRVTPA